MDRRVSKTKMLLKNSFIELLKTTNINKISITDLTEKANINRGTFYLHYTDIDDLIKQLEEEAIKGINDAIEKNVDHLLAREYYYPIFEVTTYAKQNKDFFKYMMGENGDLNFVKKIKASMIEVFYKYLAPAFQKIEDPIILASLASFIITGGIGAFIDWINTDCLYSASKIVKELDAIIRTYKFE